MTLLQFNRDKQSLTPLTIKQIHEAVMDHAADSIKVDGCDVTTVKLLGIIESVDEHSTNVNYRINDGTGALECKYWIEKDGTSMMRNANCGCTIHYISIVICSG